MKIAAKLASKVIQWDMQRDMSRWDSKIAFLPKQPSDLAQIVRAAWDAGATIDLTDTPYGPGFKPGVYFNEAPSYYRFLAGFVRSQNCKRIVEIGTHFGGASLAMVKGGADKIVTIDITDLNPKIHSVRQIRKIMGDAN